MTINAYKKGTRTERAVANQINSALGSHLRRTPMSGAFRDLPGDITTFEDSIVKEFLWEIKNRKETGRKLIGWYEKAESETPSGKTPVLIFTCRAKPFYVCIRLNYFLNLLKKIQEYETKINELIKKYENFNPTNARTDN